MDTQKTEISAVQVIKAAEHPVIDDQFCGSLTVLPNGSVIAKGFVSNLGHYHTQFEETYCVLDGQLTLALHEPRRGSITEVTLEKWDTVKIPAGVGHKVINGSEDNCVMVTCDPQFVESDETLSSVLEQRYSQSTSIGSVSLPRSNRAVLKQLLEAKLLIDDFTEYLQYLGQLKHDWREDCPGRSMYSTSDYIHKARAISKGLTELQLKAIDSSSVSDRDLVQVKSFFRSFLEDLRTGKLVIGSEDTKYFTGNSWDDFQTRSEIIEELKKNVERNWGNRIRLIDPSVELQL